MKHPLYNKVQKIVDEKIDNGKIKHSEFSDIRNQSSVRWLLSEMGYQPNCESKPTLWSKKPPKKKAVLVPVISEKVRPMKRRTPKHDGFISKLRSKKPFYLNDLDMTANYAFSIANDLRKEGWVIKPITFKAKGDLRAKTIGWKLLKEVAYL